MRPPYRLVFLGSLSILAFEIALTRIFSIRFSYHYATLIISISMTGIVFGGISVYLSRGLREKTRIGSWVLALGLSCPCVFVCSTLIPLDQYRIVWEKMQVVYLICFFLVFAVPFFCYGVVLTLCLSAYPPRVNLIYASDLLGAASGVVAVYFLLDNTALERSIAFLPLAIGVGLLCDSSREMRFRLISFGVLAVLSLAVAFGPFTVAISPFKGLSRALNEDNARLLSTIYSPDSRLDLFESPGIKFAPGLSLACDLPVPTGTGISIDGDIAGVMMDEKNVGDYRFIPFMPAALPYEVLNAKNAVIIGFKNGIDALIPRYLGVEGIYKADPDRSLAKLIRSSYGPDSIYRKEFLSTSGRQALKRIGKEMDVIFISRTGYFPSGSFGFTEEFDLTVEALRFYLSRLTERGCIFVQMFLLPPPRYELRLMNNVVHSLEGYGITDPENHLLVYRTWDTINFLIKKAGFTADELKAARSFLARRQFQEIYPSAEASPLFITGIDYTGMFGKVARTETRGAFEKAYPFNIEPSSDDRPFFHYFLKLDRLPEIYALAGKKWAYFIYEGMALPFILGFLLLLSALATGAAFVLSGGKRPAGLARVSAYFAAIGFSYMFTEVFFIHRLILPLGSPVKSFSITLTVLLFSSGAGSFLSSLGPGRTRLLAAGAAPLLLIVYFFCSDTIGSSAWGIPALVPMGILMGFFFPSGVIRICGNNTRTIPFAYAVNGAASIVSPPLASLLAAAQGSKFLLALAAGLYCAALFLLYLPGHGDKGH